MDWRGKKRHLFTSACKGGNGYGEIEICWPLAAHINSFPHTLLSHSATAPQFTRSCAYSFQNGTASHCQRIRAKEKLGNFPAVPNPCFSQLSALLQSSFSQGMRVLVMRSQCRKHISTPSPNSRSFTCKCLWRRATKAVRVSI
jgi:hypothetical protein